MMNLVTMPNPAGSHMGGWRHRDAFNGFAMKLAPIIEIAQIAERGKFDSLFLADGNAVRDMDTPELFAANTPSARPVTLEPMTMYGALAMHTNRIGLAATVTTTYEEPYNVARKFASLDHLSQGRAGWNVVTTQFAGDSKNFGQEDLLGRVERYDRAREFVGVVKGLWDSWDEDAILEDKDTGQFLDPKKVHTLEHKGKYFSVKGPLNVARTPQGHPVIFMAGQSEPGLELAAAEADALFGVGHSKAACQALYSDVKGRMGKFGRAPESLRFLAGLSVFVGRSRAEADELYAELQELISPSLGVHFLSKALNADLSGLPLDGPLPALPREIVGGTSQRTNAIALAHENKLTIRQLYQHLLPSHGNVVVKGSPTDVADTMADWLSTEACDGFMINTPVMPRGLRDFVDLVIPELQGRKLFREDYPSGGTLRDTMGLNKPLQRFHLVTSSPRIQ